MKKHYLLLSVIFLWISGCSHHNQRPEPVNSHSFFTPRNWQVPIEKHPPRAKRQRPTNQPPKRVIPLKGGPKAGEQMVGYSSWYGPGFEGKKTANGERYNQEMMTAAHKILPMNTWVRVTNLENNRSVVVRINDRGPYKKNRVIDLSKRAAELLKFKDQGTARVELKVIKYPQGFDSSVGLAPYKQVVIQIAVFSSKERAIVFRDQLARKYERIQFHIDKNNGETFHVIAGPYDQRSQAKKVSESLKTEGIDNFVRSFRK